MAVQACEAATASISRPSSPRDALPPPVPIKELEVRARLEDLIDQVNHFRIFFIIPIYLSDKLGTNSFEQFDDISSRIRIKSKTEGRTERLDFLTESDHYRLVIETVEIASRRC